MARTKSKIILKSIDLCGFKSFAEATHIELSGGINVVTAPSGCGKSNLLAACAWVLMSVEWNFIPKTIIFRGTESRPAADFAEVALAYGNAENAEGDVIIRRKIERNGGQSFFVNGEKIADWEAYSVKVKSLNLPEVWGAMTLTKKRAEKMLQKSKRNWKNCLPIGRPTKLPN